MLLGTVGKTMTEPTRNQLLDMDPVDHCDRDPWRWGYRERRIYELDDGSFWALSVEVTSGDMGGVEAHFPPVRVDRLERVAVDWVPVKEQG